MERSEEMKTQLDVLYQEYADNKGKLSAEKRQQVMDLLLAMTLVESADVQGLAANLFRFSSEITEKYFKLYAQNGKADAAVLDQILKQLYSLTEQKGKTRDHLKKFGDAIVMMLLYQPEQAKQSAQLPQLVASIALLAVKNQQAGERFQIIVRQSKGAVYHLDYSKVTHAGHVNIWQATQSLEPTISKAVFEKDIAVWAKHYGFLDEMLASAPESESSASVKAEPEPPAPAKPKPETSAAPQLTEAQATALAKKLFVSIRKEMQEGNQTLLTALSQSMAPVECSLTAMQSALEKSRETEQANARFQLRIRELEQQLAESTEKVKTTLQSAETLRAEAAALREQKAVLEQQNMELDEKLREACMHNSREASLEAERLRTDLAEALAFSYEDWLEYEFSDCDPDNYETLQIIIKKIFRALEKNGISFKGNNG